MGKKDTKTKAAEKKARTLAKQSKKADKKEKKDKRKGKDEDSESEDEDLDTILKEYAEQVGFESLMHFAILLVCRVNFHTHAI